MLGLGDAVDCRCWSMGAPRMGAVWRRAALYGPVADVKEPTIELSMRRGLASAYVLVVASGLGG